MKQIVLMLAMVFLVFLVVSGSFGMEISKNPEMETMVLGKEMSIPESLLEKAQNLPNEIIRVILIFREKPSGYRNFINSLGGRVIHDYDIIEGIAVSLPGRLVERLKELENIISIQEDREVHAFLSESVPLINADDVWSSYNGSGKTVCVVDSGIDYNHPALSGKVIAQKCYCCSNYNPQGCVSGCCPNGQEIDDNAMDDNGHGTHCAGIVASQNETYKGVAPGASLMAVKVLDSAGSGYTSDIISGIQWCSDQNADIISISLGVDCDLYPQYCYDTHCDNEPDALAINNAVDAGSVVSVASGNDGKTTMISSPACASKAISVGATTKSDQFANYTNRDEILDLLAPGGTLGGSHPCPTNDAICSAQLGGGFIGYSGTSMAAPHVAGVVALLLEANPNLIPSGVELILKDTGKNITDSETGLTFPRIDALAAIGFPKVGQLESYLIDPVSDKNVTQNKFFNFSSGVKCVGGECGNVRATLKKYVPQGLPTTCSEIWGGDCSEGPPESFDNTFDSCSYGNGNYEGINEIYLDKDKVEFGRENEVKCLTSSPTYTSDDLAIYYRNSSTGSWVQKLLVTSNVWPNYNFSVSFVPDSVVGEHQVRCSILDGTITSGDTCPTDTWYDNDDANFTVIDNRISTTIGDTPFYTISNNPQTCYNMQSGDSCNQTWQVNATGNIGNSYEFFTLYEPITHVSYIDSNRTEKINITIVGAPTEIISITLSGYPIGFGSLDPGTDDNNATSNANDSYIISVDSETTVNVDLYQKGDDFINDGSVFGVGNMTWSRINDAGTSLSVNETYDSNYPIATNVSLSTNITMYYWLDVPAGKTAGTYSALVYIKAIETGTLP